jgi:hypothetical protein
VPRALLLLLRENDPKPEAAVIVLAVKKVCSLQLCRRATPAVPDHHRYNVIGDHHRARINQPWMRGVASHHHDRVASSCDEGETTKINLFFVVDDDKRIMLLETIEIIRLG